MQKYFKDLNKYYRWIYLYQYLESDKISPKIMASVAMLDELCKVPAKEMMSFVLFKCTEIR